MPRALDRDRVGSGSRAIALLLAGALVLVVILAAQAIAAERSHRRTAESVLRGYADLAAQRFLRRAKWEVEVFGFYPAVYVLSARERQAPGSPLPDPGPLGRAERNLARAPGFLRHLFRVDLASGRIDASAGTPAELLAWVRSNLPALLTQRAGSRGEVAAISQTIAGEPRTLVYGVSPDAEPAFALAFEIDVEKLRPYLVGAYRDEPLLPAPPDVELPVQDLLFLELSDVWDRPIFRSPGAFEPALGVSRRIEDPALGPFRGMRIRSSVARGAAQRLVIGGLPRSRLPVLLGTLTIASGLLVAALVLWRRERALSQMESDFVSGVSHELRTPLAQIRLFAETLMRDRVRSEEERSRSLAIIDQEARRLSHLVENVLEFSRGRRGVIALAVTPVELETLVRETVDSFRPLAQARGNSLTLDLAPATAPVDADAIRQVLLNLFDNAVRYGPAGQEIRIALSHEDGAAILSVEDQGPGVPPEQRSEIWKKFVRLERNRGAHRAGTGIGLAVVRDLVELHRGRAWVEEGARGGAKFFVRLPCGEGPP
jgi:signal transduction histidine kinase